MRRRLSADNWLLLVSCTVTAAVLFALAWAVNAPSRTQPQPSVERLPVGVGEPAPDFALPDRTGTQHRLSEMVQRDTILCFTCGCAKCLDLQSYLAILSRKMGDRAPSVVAVTTMPKEQEQSWLRDTQLPQQIVYERKEGPVITLYHGHPCPRLFRLDADRRLKWASPPPDSVPSLREIGTMMAQELGFPPGTD